MKHREPRKTSYIEFDMHGIRHAQKHQHRHHNTLIVEESITPQSYSEMPTSEKLRTLEHLVNKLEKWVSEVEKKTISQRITWNMKTTIADIYNEKRGTYMKYASMLKKDIDALVDDGVRRLCKKRYDSIIYIIGVLDSLFENAIDVGLVSYVKLNIVRALNSGLPEKK